LAIVHIAVDITVIVGVGPHRAGKAADRRADRRAFNDADARHHCANRSATGGADGRILRDARIGGTRAKGGRAGKRNG